MFKTIIASAIGYTAGRWAHEKQIPQKALAVAVEVADAALTGVGKLAAVLQARQHQMNSKETS